MASRRESRPDVNVDGRKALGVRPSGQPPPRLHLERPSIPSAPPSPTLRAPPSPKSPPGSRNVSISIPPITIPPSPTSDQPKRFRRPTISSKSKPARLTSNRGLYETQKLLSHLLDKLETRDAAPDLLERAAISAREISGKGKGKSKGKVQRLGNAIAAAAQHAAMPSTPGSSSILSPPPSASLGSGSGPGAGLGSEDFEDINLLEGEIDTEAIFNLVEQTRGLLVLADKQGLDLFGDDRGRGSLAGVPVLDSTPVKNKRKAGRFSSIAPVNTIKPSFSLHGNSNPEKQEDEARSRQSTSTAISGSILLSRMLGILHALLTVDCLHRTHLFRPLCPPFALQAACLDIANYLYMKSNTETKIQVVGMVVDGLYGMGGMIERVCEWLEGKMGELFNRLARDRGGPNKGKEKVEDMEWTDPFSTKDAPGKAVPTFAISTESQDSLPAPPTTNTPGWMRVSPTAPAFPFFPPGDIAGLLSTQSSKDASTLTIQIASLVPRILLGITSAVDLSISKLTTIHRIHRLLTLILTAKPDSSLDLLEIIAYAPPIPRRTALEILSTFFPTVMGHNTISRRMANTTYAAQRAKWESGQERALGEDDDTHFFVPWRHSSKDGTSAETVKCDTCDGEIHGFSLRCSSCREYRHLHCYHSNVHTYDVITLSSDESAHQMVHVKYSPISPRLDEQVIYGSTLRGTSSSTRRKVGQHDLTLVNLFNLTLCEECHLPLWGTGVQAYGCMDGCQRFFHSRCLDHMARHDKGQCRFGRDVVIDEISAEGSNPFLISLDRLKQTFDPLKKKLCLSIEDLSRKTYDEIAVLWGELWVQYQLLKNGLSSGSIRITEYNPKAEPDILNLKATLKLYEEQLKLRSTEASPALSDFTHVSNPQTEQPLGCGYLFSDRCLTYVIALLRAPTSSNPLASGDQTPSDGFLTPSGLPAPDDPQSNEESFEMLPLSIISSSLASDLGISDPSIATVFLNQLRSIGLVTINNKLAVSQEDMVSPDIWAGFTLPFLMDNSTTINLLILAIDNSLDSLDLSMNEQALRLLSERCWPSLLCSSYSLDKLGKILINWIMNEDECLLGIVRNYASKHKKLPGIKSSTPTSSKINLTNGIGNSIPMGQNAYQKESSVNIYKESRIKMLNKFGKPWLRALHDLDPVSYAAMVYEECKNPLAAGKLNFEAEETDDQMASKMAGIALERMTAVVDADVIFSTLMELVTAWLEDLGALADQDVVYRSLPRLLRHSTSTSTSSTIPSSSFEQTDLFSLSRSVSQTGPEGLIRVCRWLRVLSFSGVDIPWELLMDMVELQSTSSTRNEVYARLDLVIAIGANGMPLDPEVFAGLCGKMTTGIFRDMANGGEAPLAENGLDLIRQCMLLCLRAYGVPTEEVVQTTLNNGELQTKQPASMSKRRRAVSGRANLSLDKEMVLSAASILQRTDVPCEMILDFLWLLFTRAMLVDNIDGFIHRACSKLYQLLWPLVDLPVDRKSRTRVMLKMLSVNPNALEKIVRQELDAGSEERARVRERLLTFILELADSSVVYEVSAWQSSAVGLILLLFDVLTDTSEMISDNVVILNSLLPTQLQAMSVCFENYLLRSSDEKRLVLLTRLRRLRFSLPTWPIISWTKIEELLAEEVASMNQLQPSRASQTISALMDSQSVRCSLLSLGLDMLSAGVPIPWVIAQRFQQHVASCLASPWSNPIEGITALILPSLRGVLDSSARITISGQTFESKAKKTALVGALFVPVVIDLGGELGKFEYLTQRVLLDILMVTFFKQNVRIVELAALSSLQTLAQFVATTECAENRLLALQILQTAPVRMDRESVIRAVPSVFATIAGVLVKENEAEHADSAVLEQSRVFLRGIIKRFGRSGLFIQLFRIDDTASQSPHQPSPLGKALQLLHATEQHQEGRPTIFDQAFSNLSDVLKRGRQTIEQVSASLCRFAESLQVELSEDIAQKWDAQDFDPNPALRTCAAVLDLVKPSASVPLLHQTSTFLHLSLARFSVAQDTLSKLLEVSDRVARTQSTEDTVRTVAFELAGSIVHGLNVTPTTLLTLLNFLAISAFPDQALDSRSFAQQKRVLADSAPGCLQILLRTHPTFTIGNIEPDVTLAIMLKTATVLCRAEMIVEGIISQILSNITIEAASTQVNLFIFILLASLDIQMGPARKRIISLYPLLSRATSLCLRASADLLTLQDMTGDGAELLSVVFAVFRLAILALRDHASVGTEGRIRSNMEEDTMDAFWCRIWPDWYRLLTISLDANCVNGPLKAVSHSVFLDTIIFLGTAHSSILSRHAGTLSHALTVLVKYQESQGTGNTTGKLQKAAQVLDRISTGISIGGNVGESERSGVVSTIKKDLSATERLKALRNTG
uniref:Phorbol-ester/DAG-type domain-containing protein n=1 Tax=Kwoniella dejecticola CBS 10117 TaxID=1296121 RepID=A0A1A6A2E5_9TREE|nr:uncharacterized protein I303_05088 [Kwoniella dejecticola CBS 10117]OBR84231.1 hypothetical protein I303_05088 [Kwoniella dejecticola CBS 10117]